MRLLFYAVNVSASDQSERPRPALRLRIWAAYSAPTVRPESTCEVSSCQMRIFALNVGSEPKLSLRKDRSSNFVKAKNPAKMRLVESKGKESAYHFWP